MSVLLGIPEDVTNEILSEWVQVLDIVKLHTAVSSKQFRDPFLRFLKLFQGVKTRYASSLTPYYSWIGLRGIKLRDYFVTNALETPNSFQLQAAHVEEVYYLNSTFGLALLDIVNSCVYLKSLHCISADLLKFVNLPILSKVEDLDIHGVQPALDILKIIIDNCRALTNLAIEEDKNCGYTDDTERNILLHQIISHNKHLKKINIVGCLSLLSSINTHCKDIEEIHLIIIKPIVPSLIGQFIRECSTLKLIDIQSKTCRIICRNTLGGKEVSIFGLDNPDIMEFTQFCSSLTNVTKFELSQSGVELSPQLVQAMVSCHSSTLTTICFGKDCDVTEDMLLTLKLCPQLISLTITKCNLDNGMNLLQSQSCDQLKEFRFFPAITVPKVIQIIKACPKLEQGQFCVEFNHDINDYKQFIRSITAYSSRRLECVLNCYNSGSFLLFQNGMFKGYRADTYLTPEENLLNTY